MAIMYLYANKPFLDEYIKEQGSLILLWPCSFFIDNYRGNNNNMSVISTIIMKNV